MKPTTEQQKVLEAVERRTPLVKINAYAGTGKTTTLLQIAEANRDKRILYLAFNKSIQEEAKEKFPDNVEVRTTHSLAYRSIVGEKRVVRGEYRAYEIAKLLGIHSFEEARRIKDGLESFLNSSLDEPAFFDYRLNEAVATLYKMMNSGEIDITHSFYLKEYEQRLKIKSVKQKAYDIVLLDEAQDTNEVTLSIFASIPARQKIVVGDRHQQIYSFRGSVNAMQRISAETFELTQSFRYVDKIANDASTILNTLKGLDVDIKGVDKPRKNGDAAFISRTNAKLIEKMVSLQGKKDWRTVRHPSSIFGLIRSVYKVSDGEKADPEYYFLESMSNNWGVRGDEFIESLRNYASGTKDVELETTVGIIKKYTRDEIEEAYRMAIKAYKHISPSEKGVLHLSTAHTSKGLEFDEVTVADDFRTINVLAKALVDAGGLPEENGKLLPVLHEYIEDGKLDLKAVEEINLLYVVATRARELVKDPNDSIKVCLKPKRCEEELGEAYRTLLKKRKDNAKKRKRCEKLVKSF